MTLELIILIYFSLFLSSLDSELTSLCQSVLEDFNLCLFYLPSPPNLSSTSEDEEEYESGYSFLPDLLIFRMVIICLMSVHSLKRAGNQCFVWKFPGEHPAAQLGWRCCLNWRSWCSAHLLHLTVLSACRFQAVQCSHCLHAGPLLSPDKSCQYSPPGWARRRGKSCPSLSEWWHR